MDLNKNQAQKLTQEVASLKQQHRELDLAIEAMTLKLQKNEFEIKRLKKQKLLLKDAISKLESALIPDLHA